MTGDAPRTRVVLGIVSGLIRDSIKAALRRATDLECAGEAKDIRELTPLLDTPGPSILLIAEAIARDLQPPLPSQQGGRMKVVLLVSSEGKPSGLVRYTSLNPAAVVTNEFHVADLVKVLELVNQGVSLFPGNMLRIFCGDQPASAPANLPPLSERDRKLLLLLGCGMADRQIAERLGISPSAIHTHLGRMKRKLGALNRTHLVTLAIASGLIKPGDALAAGQPPTAHNSE